MGWVWQRLRWRMMELFVEPATIGIFDSAGTRYDDQMKNLARRRREWYARHICDDRELQRPSLNMPGPRLEAFGYSLGYKTLSRSAAFPQ